MNSGQDHTTRDTWDISVEKMWNIIEEKKYKKYKSQVARVSDVLPLTLMINSSGEAVEMFPGA